MLAPGNPDVCCVVMDPPCYQLTMRAGKTGNRYYRFCLLGDGNKGKKRTKMQHSLNDGVLWCAPHKLYFNFGFDICINHQIINSRQGNRDKIISFLLPNVLSIHTQEAGSRNFYFEFEPHIRLPFLIRLRYNHRYTHICFYATYVCCGKGGGKGRKGGFQNSYTVDGTF